MKKNLFFYALTVSLITIFSCQKIDVNPVEKATLPAAKGTGNKSGFAGGNCLPKEARLVTEQNNDAGTVTVSNDADYIYITYTSEGDWILAETHLYVGDCTLIPMNDDGTPDTGLYPYAGVHTKLRTYTYQVPLSLIPVGTSGCISAQTVLVKLDDANQVIEQQTAWGQSISVKDRDGISFEYFSCL